MERLLETCQILVPMLDWLVPLLRCPRCRGALAYEAIDGSSRDGLLAHESGDCYQQYPVIDSIPRLLLGSQRADVFQAHRDWFRRSPQAESLGELWGQAGTTDDLIAGFDDEWRRFNAVGTADQAQIYKLYLDLMPADQFRREHIVLDAGCGGGRWAFDIARRGPRVIALDLGRSIEVARTNTPLARVACVQADIAALPLAPASVDWAYSLGVLHHIHEPERALRQIVEAVRPEGRVLLYLYYALDLRGPLFRGIFRAVNLTRRFTSAQPRIVARAIATAIAAMVYWPLARSAALLEQAGAGSIAAKVPLSFYRHMSFATMRHDSLDRFGTRLERRYTRAAMSDLMSRAGLVDIQISESPPYWHGVGSKPEA